MANMEELMGKLDQTMADTDAATSGGFELDAGSYRFHIKDAEICKAKNTDRIHVKMQLIVLNEGKFKNMSHWSYDLRFTDTQGNPDAVGMSWFKQACQTLGVPVPSSMKESGVSVEAMINRVFDGAIVVKGDYRNVRINKLVHPSLMKWLDEGCPEPTGAKKNDAGW